ncbi:ABC transporter-related protein [Heterostelium album PN500]|uniref:ABC transporter-related protein n=1 Tax=Heterostelium pallidum (strain ATCC 26659 / Pp 5 / PN500) TaxID=670386 RepID=D3BQP4_HETP5|nr:ABC transporter-related protein [Heterostelium album PN500]EFA76464.1 ABC transporter-related protein [Heterostelium album PN500]|eukprot:XP_020428596.1 ABC transporter-related protein [Heterostelium album PN500]
MAVSTQIKEVVKSTLGSKASELDDTIVDYICGVFEDEAVTNDMDELIEILSPFLEDVAVDQEVNSLCKSLVEKMVVAGVVKVGKKSTLQQLTQPVSLQKLDDRVDAAVAWMKPEENISIVNREQLEANERRYNARKEARLAREERKVLRQNAALAAIQQMKAQQTMLMSTVRGTNLSRDIHVENFSLNYGKMDLLINSDLHLNFGRKYGLIGRNGTGKTTLLRHIASREIEITNSLSILHVEQEVHGSDTTVLDCVLEADVERDRLLKEEARLNAMPENERNNLSSKLTDIYEKLNQIDAHTAESRAASILAGLGFTDEMQAQPTKQFSGGWRMRISLARALFIQPDVLMLDEPTNHLDLFACLWLESYLINWTRTLVIVSHQREFLNAVCTDIIHLNNRKLDYYKGNYATFESTRHDRLKSQQRAFDAQQQQRKHIQTFIDRFRYNAKRAKMAQSRIKQLERMDLISEVMDDPTITLQFLEPEPITPPILQFQDVSFGYSPDKLLFKNLNLGIDMDSRVALVGANGVGKTTLLRLLCGELNETSGLVVRHGKLRFARFSQHFVDQLDLSKSPLDNFLTTYPGTNPQTARSHLGKFGLSGDLALRTVNTLSGGQKSRVVLSQIAYTKPHVLLLDEPSNHLDIDTVDALCQALNEFQGGILMVSHDERLISLVCDEIWYFDGEDNEAKEVKVFDGDWSDYKKQITSKKIGKQDKRLIDGFGG